MGLLWSLVPQVSLPLATANAVCVYMSVIHVHGWVVWSHLM